LEAYKQKRKEKYNLKKTLKFLDVGKYCLSNDEKKQKKFQQKYSSKQVSITNSGYQQRYRNRFDKITLND